MKASVLIPIVPAIALALLAGQGHTQASPSDHLSVTEASSVSQVSIATEDEPPAPGEYDEPAPWQEPNAPSAAGLLNELTTGAASLGEEAWDRLRGLFETQDALSREFTFYNASAALWESADAIAREFTFYNAPAAIWGAADAVSREFTFYNETWNSHAATSAISREFSFCNHTWESHESTDAISREFSFQNETTLITAVTDAVSREFSFYMPVADLELTVLDAPALATAGLPIDVSWQTANIGGYVAEAPWHEAVYLSTDEQRDGGDTLLVTVQITEDLPQGSIGAPHTQTVTLHGVEGDFFLLFVADEAGDVFEDDELANNLVATAITIEPLPQPDLSVAEVIGPSAVDAGDAIIIEYTVENIGTLAAALPWQDAMYLSADTKLDPNDDTLLRLDPIGVVPLPPEAGYSRSRTVTVPIGWPSGPAYLLVQTDYGHVIDDADRANNVQFSDPIDVTAAPAPDLVAADVLTVDTAVFGETINVTWTGQNIGTSNAVGVWSDMVLLSADDQPSPDDRFLGLLSINVTPLPPNDPPYAQALDVTLPLDLRSVPGDYHVLVVVDGNGAIDELDENNNSAVSGLLTITLPDLPDLSALDVQGPSTVAVGETVTVNWQVQNAGAIPTAGSFICTVYGRVPGGTGDPIPLANVVFDGILAAGTSAPLSGDVIVPELKSAEIEFEVCVDTFDDVLEFDEHNNCTAATAPTPYDRPDLAVVPIIAPTTVLAESVVPLTLTIDNVGVADALPSAYWLDAVYLSNDNVPGADLLLGTFPHTAAVTAGDTYDVAANVTIPSTLAGDYYFVIATDINDQLIEAGSPANNAWVAETPTTITQPPRANLVVSSITTPPAGLSGQVRPLTFEVTNTGSVDAQGFWVDRVYASTDSVVNSNDIILGDFPHTGPLAAGTTYQQTIDITYPSLPDAYHIIVTTDYTNALFEGTAGGENDNTAVTVEPFDVTTFEVTALTASVQGLRSHQVELSGSAVIAGTSEPAADVPVVVRIGLFGFERKLTARTDPAGLFTTTFVPGPTEGGHYSVKAGPAHILSSALPVLATFDLYTLVTLPDELEVRALPGIPVEGTLRLKNPGDLPQMGIQWAVSNAPPEILDLVLMAGNNLPAFGSTLVEYTLTVAPDTAFTNPVEVTFTGAEGGQATLAIELTVGPADPAVELVPEDLDADGYAGGNMPLGERTYAQARIRNVGGSATDALTVHLPNPYPWISLATPNPLPALNPGDEAAIVLQLDPPTDLAFGTYYVPIPVEFGAGQSINVPFKLVATSTGVGSLLVTCTDEFTYYDEVNGFPPVSGADVRITDSITGVLVAQVLSDANGQALFEGLTEAYYNLEVTAADHGTFRTMILVRGGQVTKVEAFMPRQVVSYNWTVIPIDVEDRYLITIQAEFQTNVPVPVVVVEPAALNLDDLTLPAQVNFTVTNYGLITAQNVRFSVRGNNDVDLIPLVTEIGDLPGGCSEADPVGPCRVTVPVLIVPTGKRGARNDCSPLGISACWELVCGDKTYTYCANGTVYTDQCPPTGGVVAPVGQGGGACCTYVPPCCGPTLSIPCDFCIKPPDAVRCLTAAMGCFDVPCPGNAAGCAGGNWSSDPLGAALGCARQAAACAVDVGVGLACPVCSAMSCVCSLIRDCMPTCEDTSCIPCSLGDALAWALGNPCGGSKHLDRGTWELPLYDAAYDTYRATTRYLAAQWYPFGNDAWALTTQPGVFITWLDAFNVARDATSEDGIRISALEWATLLATPYPNPLTPADVELFLQRWNRTQDYYDLGYYTVEQLPAGWNTDFIDQSVMQHLADGVVADQLAAQDAGFDSVLDAMDYYRAAIVADIEDVGEGVCATVRIQLDQSATLTRSGFRATLEIDNGGDDPLEAILVDVIITDINGVEATDRFGIYPPELTGALTAVDGTGSLPGSLTGTASWVIVPTDEAAPLEPAVYFVSGVFEYAIGGSLATIPLYPVRIDVLPNPNLELKYFLETQVFSDDPFTPELEPAIPFSLGLLVANTGAGVARNMTITSAQPEIIENHKGLLIDFDIIGTQVGNDPIAPSLTVDLGDIGPDSTAVARWLMISTLQGEFISYSASFEHVDSLGDPRLSLIESVDIFDLTHVVRADEPSGGLAPDDLYDFLTNDFWDPESLPDRLHHSDNRVEVVNPATNATIVIHPETLTADVTVAMFADWTYIRIDDPFDGHNRLASVQRVADGKLIEMQFNAWQTSRVDRSSPGSPVERYVHIFDRGGTGEYLLTFNADSQGPSITAWRSVATHGALGELGLPIAPGTPGSEPRQSGIQKLVVTFDEPIDPATFTASNVYVDGFDINGQAVTIPPLTTSLTLGDQAGVITFDAPLPPLARYCVTLVGVADGSGNLATGAGLRLDITALPGDATGDRRVNNTDVGGVGSLVVTPEIDPADLYQLRSDVNADGVIDSADIAIVLGARGTDARVIPNPCLILERRADEEIQAQKLERPQIQQANE